MKTTISLFAASTVLAAAIGLPAWSAVQPLGDADVRPVAAVPDRGPDAAPVILASDDDGEDRRRAGRGHDDDDDDHGRGGRDDDDNGRGGARNPAPAGAVAPPANGLFGTGAPPRVQVN